MPEVVEFKLTDPKKYPIYPFKRTTHHNSTLRVHAPSQTLDPETGLKIGSIALHFSQHPILTHSQQLSAFQLTTTRAAELFPTLKRRTSCFSAGTVTPQLSLVEDVVHDFCS